MSILDHKQNYTMDYNENPSSSIGGKFFWFSGYYNIGIKEILTQNEQNNEESKSDDSESSDPAASSDENGTIEVDPQLKFGEEVDRNIDIVNGLIAELKLPKRLPVEEENIKCIDSPDVANEPDKSDISSEQPVNGHCELEDSLLVNTSHVESVDNNRVESSTTPVRPRIWFRYNDKPIVEPPPPVPPRPVQPVNNGLIDTKKDDTSDIPKCDCPVGIDEGKSEKQRLSVGKSPAGVYFKLLPTPLVNDKPDGVDELPDKMLNDSVGNNKLISSLDDLISEVNGQTTLELIDNALKEPLLGQQLESVPNVNETVIVPDEIPSLESIEKALCELGQHDQALSTVSDHVPTGQVKPVGTKPSNDHKSELFVNDEEKSNPEELTGEMNFGAGVFFKLHAAPSKGDHITEKVISVSLHNDTKVNDDRSPDLSEPVIKVEDDDSQKDSKKTVEADAEPKAVLTEPLSEEANEISEETEIDDVPPSGVEDVIEVQEEEYSTTTVEVLENIPTHAYLDEIEVASVDLIMNDLSPDITHGTVIDDIKETGSVCMNEPPSEPNIEDVTNHPCNVSLGDGFQGDETFTIGTWFGVAGRTYRAKPMENLLDIDVLDDVPIRTDCKEKNRLESISSQDISFDERNVYDIDFRKKNVSEVSQISEISEISEISDTTLEVNSTETELTIVSPVENFADKSLLKLHEESSMEDDVFIDNRIEETIPLPRGISLEESCPVNEQELNTFNDVIVENDWSITLKGVISLPNDLKLRKPDDSTEHNRNQPENIDLLSEEKDPDSFVEISVTEANNNDEESDDDDFTEITINDYVAPHSDELSKSVDEIIPDEVIMNGETTEAAPISHKEDVEFISSYLTDSTKKESDDDVLAKQNSLSDDSVGDRESFAYTSDDETNPEFGRGTSFRRSIVIEDEVSSGNHSRQSSGLSTGSTTHVSAFYFTPSSPQVEGNGLPDNTSMCNHVNELLNYLDNIVINGDTFGKDFEVVKKLHALFWGLKDDRYKNSNNPESLSSVLNYMVVQEWPKVFVSVFKKLKLTYPHVFENHDQESIVYYSGHMPSILRMNRTSSEFAVAVIFDGLLMSAINFTDVHEASRQASCEDDLIGYLLTEIMPHLHSIHWGKATAKEMFLKSICSLIYNCCQSPSNVSYLIDNDLVNVFTMVRDEISEVVDARKVNMTMLLSMSYLIDDNNYDRIVPDEGVVVKILQFLDKSLEHSEHVYFDFSSFELASCLSKIAAHDSNKSMITRNSGQEILHKLLKYAFNNEEKIAACEALWNMSFNREAKHVLRGMGKLMSQLRELKKSDDFLLRNAASGVLWECEEKYDIKGTREAVVRYPRHIMISYEYESQPLVISVRDELEQLGFKVWMSSDESSLTDIMSKGVEGASIVIVAVTRKYKQEPYTFAEVDYAHSLRKTIIPLIIDMEFMPDGWLSQLIRKEKTFDFSRRSMFNGSLDALVEYLKILQKGDDATVKINFSDTGARKERDADVLSWTNADVLDWLKENRLIRNGNAGGRLQKLTGFHLLMFYDLKKETPDYYYSVLDSHLGFKDVLDTLEFTYALDRLLGSERLI